MWCPNCGAACDRNAAACPNCGAGLSEQAAEREAQKPSDTAGWPSDLSGKPEKAEFLCHADSEMDAAMITCQLGAYGVPVKQIAPEIPGSGLFRLISGISVTGYDLYVPEGKVALATELLNPPDQAAPGGSFSDREMEILSEENDLFFTDILISELQAERISAKKEEVSPFLCRVWAEKDKIGRAREIYAELTSGKERQ